MLEDLDIALRPLVVNRTRIALEGFIVRVIVLWHIKELLRERIHDEESQALVEIKSRSSNASEGRKVSE